MGQGRHLGPRRAHVYSANSITPAIHRRLRRGGGGYIVEGGRGGGDGEGGGRGGGGGGGGGRGGGGEGEGALQMVEDTWQRR
uniref:Uncharacterized protein n=1 Tax=Vespula pensylvanica TaxID=30213 RepID=A0A834NGP2_VESPE|nr:hypothetical protein H0235_014444 [Vespula pensylvanica]